MTTQLINILIDSGTLDDIHYKLLLCTAQDYCNIARI